MDRDVARRLLAEFVGTFTLIFIGAGSIVASGVGDLGGAALVTVALAHGLAIATMVSAVGHVSGGHFNPAVTIGAVVTGKIGFGGGIAYVLAQLAGGLAGAGILRLAVPESAWRAVELGTPAVGGGVSTGQAVLIEAVLTFFLVWVIFASAIDDEGAFGKIAGLAIGLVIAMDIMAGGPFTGGAMNPARAFGPAVAASSWTDHWVYWAGPIAGGVVAAAAYHLGILETRRRRLA